MHELHRISQVVEAGMGLERRPDERWERLGDPVLVQGGRHLRRRRSWEMVAENPSEPLEALLLPC